MRRQPVTGLLVLPALLALALAGCGTSAEGDGVATAGGAAGAGPTASASAAAFDDADRQLKFAQCMRENGVDMPDPDPAAPGQVRINGGSDPDKAQAAMEKCREFLPNGGEGRKLDPEQAENMRKMAQCMRENGIPDFPDPGPDGLLKIDKSLLGGKGLDDPTLKAAMEKCKQFAPKIAGTGK
ncbi:hypothetical protein [Micromonospora sp. NBC_01796]|uniref:hypothetical protein n=1 Tax=Micromonospora sp. NBC_01796 TaxID=2975987 RepID=UPI002DD87909|nr:hypothetical protein [Micromonospora sp. NBC_01796]WSA88379.1 hypothetical protein OIE47_12650 [Micromonospora sp. NBC_01796]